MAALRVIGRPSLPSDGCFRANGRRHQKVNPAPRSCRVGSQKQDSVCQFAQLFCPLFFQIESRASASRTISVSAVVTNDEATAS